MAEGRQSGDAGGGDEMYLCPLCSTQVSINDVECPSCHAIFVDDDEAPPSPAPAKKEEKALSLEYRCPNCDGAVVEDDKKCPNCGAVFMEEGEEAPPEAKVPEKRPGRKPIAAVQRRGTRAQRHSKAVRLLSMRRKRIAQRRMIGWSLIGGGWVLYFLTLSLDRSSSFSIIKALSIGASVVVIILGILIYYNQYHAWNHYQQQLAKATVEAALLKELAKTKPAAATTSAPPTTEEPQMASADAPEPSETWEGATPVAEPAPESPPATAIKVEVTAGADEPDKVPCRNCGYMNRKIFVRCIRCGTELVQREETISVETFERPKPTTIMERRETGRAEAPVPWEAKLASAQGGRASARKAARDAALADAEASMDTQGADRRAAIGVAANFAKLPRTMREELIRTLYRVEDPAVRQDVVSAVSENFTELPKDIQDLLFDLADDEDPRVREEVAFELNRNFDRIPLDMIQTLFGKLAKDTENMVREDVVSAITENFQRLPKETQDLLKTLAQDSVESVRDEVSFEIAKNSDVVPEKFRSEVIELIKRARM
jgi:hypothetical protein